MKNQWIGGLSFLILPTVIWAAAKVPTYHAVYGIYHSGHKVGTSTQTLTYQNNDYRFFDKTAIDVLFYHQHYSELSVGKFTGDGYQPHEYTYQQKGKVTYQADEFSPNEQDALSQELMLRYKLLANEPINDLTVRTVNGKKIYKIKMIDRHYTADTKFGKLDTVHVRYYDDKGYLVDEWLAKKFDYLPVYTQLKNRNKIIATIYLLNFS